MRRVYGKRLDAHVIQGWKVRDKIGEFEDRIMDGIRLGVMKVVDNETKIHFYKVWRKEMDEVE